MRNGIWSSSSYLLFSFYFFMISSISEIYGTDYVPNLVNDYHSCDNTFGQFWDQSKCSACQNNDCACSTYEKCDSCVKNKFMDTFHIGQQISAGNDYPICRDCPDGCYDCCERQTLTHVTCTSCKTGYTLISGSCISTNNCKTFINGTKLCGQCLDSYYLDENLGCQKCDASCGTCRTQYDCITCSSGTHHQMDGFPNICQDCKCSTGDKCDSAGVCSTPVVVEVPKMCLDADMAANCDYQYYDYQAAKCLCQRCKVGFYLVRLINSESINNCTPCEFNGARCLDNTITKNFECKENYVLDLDTQICTDNTTLKCRILFGGDCLECETGFYTEYDTTSNQIQCFQYQEAAGKCEKYTNQGSQCSTCKDGYYLNDELICVSCIDANCSKCDQKTGKCLKCNSKYRVNEGKCEACTNQFCSICDVAADDCTTCISSYGLDPQANLVTEQCIKCSDHCLTCDFEFRKCTQCEDNYFISQFICKPFPKNCINMFLDSCILCNPGYSVKGGTCMKCSNDDLGLYTCPDQCWDNYTTVLQLLWSVRMQFEVILLLLGYLLF